MITTENLDGGINPWLTLAEGYGRLGGRVAWQPGAAPRFAAFTVKWPLVSVTLVSRRSEVAPATLLQIRHASWHAHFPKRRLHIPSTFRISAAGSRDCCRIRNETSFAFDFTGLAPLPTNDIERRAIVLLDEIDTLRRVHPDVLDRLGIVIDIKLRDDPDS